MEFLSPAWIHALDRAARQHRAPPGPTADALIIEHCVTDTGRGDVRYRLTLGPGSLRVHEVTGDAPPDGPGRADDATPVVTLTCDEGTARAIARHQEAPQRAFLDGRLRLGGDVTALLAHRRALEALGDLFADVRSRTRW